MVATPAYTEKREGIDGGTGKQKSFIGFGVSVSEFTVRMI
jgi:hypothetical protein